MHKNEHHYFPSKIGKGIVGFIMVIIFGTSILMVYQKLWIGVIMNFVIGLFIFHLFFNTYYVIKDGELIIRCGFLYKMKVKIAAIRKISETNMALSAPAASLDRLEIIYNKFDRVLVSPKDKKGFLKQLQQINPAIEIRLKKDKI